MDLSELAEMANDLANCPSPFSPDETSHCPNVTRPAPEDGAFLCRIIGSGQGQPVTCVSLMQLLTYDLSRTVVSKHFRQLAIPRILNLKRLSEISLKTLTKSTKVISRKDSVKTRKYEYPEN